MKNNLFILTILLIVITACNSSHKLKITDLKFADYGNDQIIQADVDTMFVITAYGTRLSGTDTLGFQTYDSGGNLLQQAQTTPGGNYALNQYDSLGLLKHKIYDTDNKAEYNLSYHFAPDSRMLYQYWAGKTSDTSTYKFDTKGNLVEATGCSDVDSGRQFHYKTTYIYNPEGQLSQKRRELLVSVQTLIQLENNLHTAISNLDTTDYYYTNHRLETSVTTYTYPTNPKLNYSSKTYYNNNGLRNLTVSANNQITRYAYSTRQISD